MLERRSLRVSMESILSQAGGIHAPWAGDAPVRQKDWHCVDPTCVEADPELPGLCSEPFSFCESHSNSFNAFTTGPTPALYFYTTGDARAITKVWLPSLVSKTEPNPLLVLRPHLAPLLDKELALFINGKPRRTRNDPEATMRHNLTTPTANDLVYLFGKCAGSPSSALCRGRP